MICLRLFVSLSCLSPLFSIACKMLHLHQRSAFFFYSSSSSQSNNYLKVRFLLTDFDLFGVKSL
ncbi:hypothetical protein Hanom_Chr11g00989431 [Helianthus anomalus]